MSSFCKRNDDDVTNLVTSLAMCGLVKGLVTTHEEHKAGSYLMALPILYPVCENSIGTLLSL